MMFIKLLMSYQKNKSIKKGQGHVIPVHTHVINRHIYNHTYKPEYTCSEENQIINNECGCRNNFLNR